MAFRVLEFPQAAVIRPVVTTVPWWAEDLRIWLDASVGNVSRPTEREALYNIVQEIKGMRTPAFRQVLSPLECEIYDLELTIKRTMPHFETQRAVAQEIASRLKMGFWQVQAYLDEISQVMRAYEIESAEDVVGEVLAEFMQGTRRKVA